jgi:hypothetical protein
MEFRIFTYHWSSATLSQSTVFQKIMQMVLCFETFRAAGIRGPVGQDEMASTKSTKAALSDKEQSKAADVASMLGTTARHRPPEPFCHGGCRE